MSQPAIDPKLYTPSEYLALEEKSKQKHEYYNGEIVLMAGASYTHNVIASNLTGMLYNAFMHTDCQALVSDMKVRIEWSNDFTYPDVVIICGEPDFYKDRTDTITNPIVVFEVLSPSTQKLDLSDKLEKYASLPTVQNYVLINQKRVLVMNYQRLEENRWLTELYTNQENVLQLPSIKAELPVTQIYNRVRFKQKQK